MPFAKRNVNEKEAVELRTQKETIMRALLHTQSGSGRNEASIFPKKIMSKISQLSESIWLCITFLLFIALGPFSAIAVMYGLWALATDESKKQIGEPASC